MGVLVGGLFGDTYIRGPCGSWFGRGHRVLGPTIDVWFGGSGGTVVHSRVSRSKVRTGHLFQIYLGGPYNVSVLSGSVGPDDL